MMGGGGGGTADPFPKFVVNPECKLFITKSNLFVIKCSSNAAVTRIIPRSKCSSAD